MDTKILMDEYIDITISSNNIKYFRDSGYKCERNEIIKVKISDLRQGSHEKIRVKCPNCEDIREIEYRNMIKYNHTYCRKCTARIKNTGIKHINRKTRDIVPNQVEITESVVKVFTNDKNGIVNNYFLIDIEDYKTVRQYRWCHGGVNECFLCNIKGKTVKLHRMLFDIDDKEYAHHINNDRHDYTRGNIIISKEKYIKKEEVAYNESKVKMYDNIKYEEIDEHTYRLLNIRRYNRNKSHRKDIIIKIDNNGCWNCISHAQHPDGYVYIFNCDGKSKLHRVVLGKKLNKSLKPEELCRHKCDNPQCCNPDHLEVGDSKQNYDDMVRRGRAHYQRNPKNKKEKNIRTIKGVTYTMNKDTVSDIYIDVIQNGMTQREACNKYDLSRGIVQSIINKITWKHITDELDKSITNHRYIKAKELEDLISNLSKGRIYSNRHISRLTGLNRESVRKKINNIKSEVRDATPVIYVADMIYHTTVDGEGIRDSIYSSFCSHECLGCHNRKTWDVSSGVPIDVDELFESIKNSPSQGVTFSGGDPMEQSEAFYILANKIKKETEKSIWCYTGYTFEEIIKDKDKLKLLSQCDVLVDGKFEIDKRDIQLAFRGSSNQRIIDVQESLKQNKVILKIS